MSLKKGRFDMLKIGMVGAENSHTAAIAKVLNIDKKNRGV